MSKLTIKQSVELAKNLLNKDVKVSNISYLVNYGLIGKDADGLIDEKELIDYYEQSVLSKKKSIIDKLGDVNWELSFDNLSEIETTKHVHRLHQYKGKYIPQLVQYFLDRFFEQGMAILDPFCGSGTTLVQCLESGMHSIGVDVSNFNIMICNAKTRKYDIDSLRKQTDVFTKVLKYVDDEVPELSGINEKYFPSPQFKKDYRDGKITKDFLEEKESLARKTYKELEFNSGDDFLSSWYSKPVYEQLKQLSEMSEDSEEPNRTLIRIIISRTAHTCRATSHTDLGTIKKTVMPYYCRKHFKICKPILTISNWWHRYVKDTLTRLEDFSKLRKDVKVECIACDSRVVELPEIDGIICSPPYIGVIDYHEQHSYGYELFGIKRNDDLEIGSLKKKQSKAAIEEYVKGMTDVFVNCGKYLKKDGNMFIVANDKFELYPRIIKESGFSVVKEYKRPVLNRLEGTQPYAENIYHVRRIA